MLYDLIRRKRDRWFAEIPVTHAAKDIMRYILKKDALRDAQIDAVKTYLFLKLECDCLPLWQLFTEGRFNSLDVNELAIKAATREYFLSHPASAALYEYAVCSNKDGKPTAPALVKLLESAPETVDAVSVFRKIFYGVTYTDYVFSLPMGAGKTFLMAAFIYLDLYFARLNREDPRFAHNFMIFAPSGLKSSIVPSLRKIQQFDPSWIIAEPAATNLKRLMTFEVLDEQKSANKSNRVKNPNAHKVNNFLTTNCSDDMGFVAVTNAEKVILDRYVDMGELDLPMEEQERVRLANEFRSLIGRLPNLSIFIDEVHHAADGEIKLRKVVTQWAQQAENHFVQTIGFSGTPFLEKAEEVTYSSELKTKSSDLSNIVYHYPLVKGLGNFLKIPRVQVSDANTPEAIVTSGVEDFLKQYRDTVYADGTTAKLAIYCGQIENLEERIAPAVTVLLTEAGLDPTTALLKFHRGNKEYPTAENAESEFALLDSPLSKVRVVLLAQIGKEGWDCRSLTGVILPHQGACPNNMVLQTSCRCLRQTQRGAQESALIWLNKYNADKLNKQLKQQQNVTLKEFGEAVPVDKHIVERYDRTTVADVPPIEFYQFRVVYETVTEKEVPRRKRLAPETVLMKQKQTLITEQDLEGNEKAIRYEAERERPEALSFFGWLVRIAKESLGNLPVKVLREEEAALKVLYDAVTVDDGGVRKLSVDWDQMAIRSNIRRAFYPKRDFVEKESLELCRAELVDASRWQTTFAAETLDNIVPDADAVNAIREWDEGRQQGEVPAAVEEMIRNGLEAGYFSQEAAAAMRADAARKSVSEDKDPHPERLQTYHYAPYRFDSALESDYFRHLLAYIKSMPNVRAYFNGDDTVTGFRIRCYKKNGDHWRNIGVYVPDFVILRKNDDGTVDRILIVETKGAHLREKFADRRKFMEQVFTQKNSDAFHCEKFRFLYLEDSEAEADRTRRTIDELRNYFD